MEKNKDFISHLKEGKDVSIRIVGDNKSNDYKIIEVGKDFIKAFYYIGRGKGRCVIFRTKYIISIRLEKYGELKEFQKSTKK